MFSRNVPHPFLEFLLCFIIIIIIFPGFFPGIDCVSSKQFLDMISGDSHIAFQDLVNFVLGISTLLARNLPLHFQECPVLLSSCFSCCFLGMS